MALDPATGEVASVFKAAEDWQMLFPAWSQDGKSIAAHYKKGAETRPGIHILSADGSTERLLWNGPAIPSGWSPDGKWLFASEPVSGGLNILAINPRDGRGEVLFTIALDREIGGSGSMRAHTVDGRRFVFEGRKILSDVWMMENFDPEVK